MKMRRRLGIASAAAFALAASTSVSAFIAMAPAGSASRGNPYATQNCGCVGTGIAGKVACFACCTATANENRTYNISPDTIVLCFTQCGLERRSNPCRFSLQPGQPLPGR